MNNFCEFYIFLNNLMVNCLYLLSVNLMCVMRPHLRLFLYWSLPEQQVLFGRNKIASGLDFQAYDVRGSVRGIRGTYSELKLKEWMWCQQVWNNSRTQEEFSGYGNKYSKKEVSFFSHTSQQQIARMYQR